MSTKKKVAKQISEALSPRYVIVKDNEVINFISLSSKGATKEELLQIAKESLGCDNISIMEVNGNISKGYYKIITEGNYLNRVQFSIFNYFTEAMILIAIIGSLTLTYYK